MIFNTRKYNIKGVLIILEDSYFLNPFKRKKMAQIILDGIARFRFLEEFKEVKIAICKKYTPDEANEIPSEYDKSTIAHIDPIDLERGIKKIYFNGPLMNDIIENPADWSTRIEDTIVHELTHIYQATKNKTRMEKVSPRILSTLEDASPAVNALVLLRAVLNGFTVKLCQEGIAAFEAKYSGKNMDSKEFMRLYANSVKLARQVEELTANLMSVVEKDTKKIDQRYEEMTEAVLKFCEVLIRISDEIGIHMAYSILFLDSKIRFEKLASLSHLGFIKKYEEVMLDNKHKPTISLRSEKGFFDYNQKIIALNKTYILIDNIQRSK